MEGYSFSNFPIKDSISYSLKYSLQELLLGIIVVDIFLSVIDICLPSYQVHPDLSMILWEKNIPHCTHKNP